MFKRILAPIDASRCAQTGLRTALRLAKANAAVLTVCHVVDLAKSGAALVDAGSSTAVPVDLGTGTGDALLKDADRQARALGVEAKTRLLHGAPASSIATFATEVGADVIVIGSHGFGGLARLLLGSVTEGVLRSAEIPVIVIREEHQPSGQADAQNSFKQVLVAYDGSAHSECALKLADLLSAPMETALSICYVVDLPKMLDSYGTASPSADSVINTIAAQDVVNFNRAASKHGRPSRTYLRSGHPADEILRCGREIGADLIVLGSHGASGIPGLFLGSVAEEVMRKSSVPVLIIGGRVTRTATHAETDTQTEAARS